MKKILNHEDAKIVVESLISGRRKILVKPLRSSVHISRTICETSYPIDLIDNILKIKGPGYLCDEIARDESPTYVRKNLEQNLLSYLKEEEFKGKRILDFGCGSGASTVILCRMFPDAEVVGIDLEDRLLSIARLRAKHYGFNNIRFLLSPNAKSLPTKDIGQFDYVIVSAVFEHLLPNERKVLLPKIWAALKPNGILFLDETPYRYFPIESHTTGLPFINYLPDKIALLYARKFSKRNLKNDDWDILLRNGIRGGSIKEIMGILGSCSHNPLLLSPSRLGRKDRIDVWLAQVNMDRFGWVKKSYYISAKVLKIFTSIEFLPQLALAIRKNGM